MSWTQGIQPREDLPASFVEWADSKITYARLQYITWFADDPGTLFLDYGLAGSLKLEGVDG